jgi:hypothetical protein
VLAKQQAYITEKLYAVLNEYDKAAGVEKIAHPRRNPCSRDAFA